MCGLVGILNLKGNNNFNSYISSMISSIAHRGPDNTSQGSHKNFFYGFNRLSIIDLSNNGQQPFIDNLSISMSNCEIYNFQELKKKDILKSYRYKSDSDAEIIPALYMNNGIEFLDMLDGMFAISLYDKNNDTLFLARDRLGIKPLYYYFDNDNLIYASELKALLKINLVKKDLNLNSLNKFLISGFVNNSQSMFKKIKMLKPGSYLKIRGKEVSLQTYYNKPNKFINFTKTSDILSNFEEKLNKSVQSHLIADVPTSLMLSKGKDSNILKHKIQELNLKNFKTFTLGFDNFNKNEIFLNDDKNHTNFKLDFNGFQSSLDGYINSLDNPTIDGLNTYLLTKLIASKGYRVVLSGMGADELLGGYGTFSLLPNIFNSNIKQKSLKIFTHYLKFFLNFKRYQKINKLSKAKNFENIYSVFRDYSDFNEVFEIQKIFNNNISYSNNENREFSNGWRYTQELEIENYLQNRLLPDSDNFSMANSVELRVPFLSNSLIDFCLSIDFNKFNNISYPKKILDILYQKKIQNNYFNKKKQGFELPMNYWLKKNEMKNKIIESFNDHELIKVDSRFRFILDRLWKLFIDNKIDYEIIWKYYILNMWMKNYNISI